MGGDPETSGSFCKDLVHSKKRLRHSSMTASEINDFRTRAGTEFFVLSEEGTNNLQISCMKNETEELPKLPIKVLRPDGEEYCDSHLTMEELEERSEANKSSVKTEEQTEEQTESLIPKSSNSCQQDNQKEDLVDTDFFLLCDNALVDQSEQEGPVAELNLKILKYKAQLDILTYTNDTLNLDLAEKENELLKMRDEKFQLTSELKLLHRSNIALFQKQISDAMIDKDTCKLDEKQGIETLKAVLEEKTAFILRLQGVINEKDTLASKFREENGNLNLLLQSVSKEFSDALSNFERNKLVQQEQISLLTARINYFDSELTEKDTIISNLEKSLSDKESDNELSRNDQALEKFTSETAASSVDTRAQLIQNSNSFIFEFEKLTTNPDAIIVELQSKNEQLHSQLETLKAVHEQQIASTTEKLSELNMQLSFTNRKLENSTMELNYMQNIVKNLEKSKPELEARGEKVLSLLTENANLQEKFHTAKANYEEAAFKLLAIETRFDDSNAEFQILRAIVTDLEECNIRLKEENDQLKIQEKYHVSNAAKNMNKSTSSTSILLKQSENFGGELDVSDNFGFTYGHKNLQLLHHSNAERINKNKTEDIQKLKELNSTIAEIETLESDENAAHLLKLQEENEKNVLHAQTLKHSSQENFIYYAKYLTEAEQKFEALRIEHEKLQSVVVGLENLKSEYENATSIALSLKNENQKLHEEVQNLRISKEEVKSSTAEAFEIMKQCSISEHKDQELAVEYEKLYATNSSDIKELKAEISQSDSLITNLRTKNQHLQEQVDVLKNFINANQEQVTDESSKLFKDEKKLDDANFECELLRAATLDLGRLKSDLESEISAIQEKNKKISIELEATRIYSKKNVLKCAKKMAEASSKIAHLESQLEDVYKELEVLNSDLELKNLAISTLEGEKKELLALISREEESMEEVWNKKLAASEVRTQLIQQDLDIAENDIKQSETELFIAKTALVEKDLKGRNVGNGGSRNFKSNYSFESIEQELSNENDSENDKKKCHNNDENEKIQELSSKFKKLEETLQTVTHTNTSLSEAIKVKEREKIIYQNNIDQIAYELEGKNSKIAELNNLVSQLRGKSKSKNGNKPTILATPCYKKSLESLNDPNSNSTCYWYLQEAPEEEVITCEKCFASEDKYAILLADKEYLEKSCALTEKRIAKLEKLLDEAILINREDKFTLEEKLNRMKQAASKENGYLSEEYKQLKFEMETRIEYLENQKALLETKLRNHGLYASELFKSETALKIEQINAEKASIGFELEMGKSEIKSSWLHGDSGNKNPVEVKVQDFSDDVPKISRLQANLTSEYSTEDINKAFNSMASDSFDQDLSGGPLTTGCYNIDIYVTGVKFNVQVDTGSSDLLIPGSSIKSYVGPTYEVLGKTAFSSQSVGASFQDTSYWTGAFYYDTVGIDENGVTVNAPFAVMLSQSSSPTVTDGTTSQGLIGLAFDSLSTINSLELSSDDDSIPKTVFSALTDAKLLDSNIISFRTCPETSQDESLVDWGGFNSSLTCTFGSSSPNLAWIAIISESYYTVNVTEIFIGSTSVNLDVSSWQKTNSDLSIFDSCTTILSINSEVFHQFVSTLTSIENAWGTLTNSSNLNSFLLSGYGFTNVNINFSMLPDLTFSLLADDLVSIVQVNIPPEFYIQQDSNGNYYFTVSSQSGKGVVFGGTFFDNFFIVLDRENSRIGLGPGCDCALNNAMNIRMPTAKIVDKIFPDGLRTNNHQQISNAIAENSIFNNFFFLIFM
ncbi:Beta-secretase 2 [Physocladia obscura]|uniref:Beta-secretase 2 n=1 Tax=Physocladia obscura TaxID=109957 RepID=A0AAD5TAB1_9FUNG|nr:Beta-secretase 2 [Physocladia obscura]